MLLENIGNIPVSPSKVVFRIYEKSGNVLLEETENIGKIEKVDPFATKKIFAEIPTRLPAGSYIGRFEIYNDDEVKMNGEVTISILPFGTLQAAGFGFLGLSLPHKLSVILPIVFLVSIVILLLLKNSSLKERISRKRSR